MNYIGNIPYGNDLTHFGIKGMHWGIRRFQNPDGTLTAAGKARYGDYNTKKEAKIAKSLYRGDKLLDKKRTKVGAVGRGIVRQIGINAAANLATGVLAVGTLSNPASAAFAIATAGSMAINSLALGGSVANLITTGRQFIDIGRAEARRMASYKNSN